MDDEYYFGNCKICNKFTQLKNGLCINCNDNEIPDFFKDFFKKIE